MASGFIRVAKQMNIVTGMSKKLPPPLMQRVAEYRHKVFVQKLGWSLNCAEEGLEYDQFDREDTVYVVAQDDDDTVIGVARLLPTTRPYLLSEVFPHLRNGEEPPACEQIWELSRFAAVNLNESSWAPRREQFSSAQAATLLRSAMACARSLGAEHLITVSPLGVERLLRREGIRAYRAGKPSLAEGQRIFASWIPLG